MLAPFVNAVELMFVSERFGFHAPTQAPE